MDPIREPVAPPDYEKRFYYHGIGGRLIARTSTFEFPRGHTDFVGPEERRFFTIGQHEILNLWSDELIQSIQLALEGIQWQRFYPIRIGLYSSFDLPIGKPDRALVLTIDVPYDSTDWDTAIKAARKCLDIFRSANMLDIEVDVRGITRTFLAMDVELEKVIEKHYQSPGGRDYSRMPELSYPKMLPVLSSCGYRIVSEDEAGTYYYGTMGLHLRLSGRPCKLYGFTCRHVAHRPVNPTLCHHLQPSPLPYIRSETAGNRVEGSWISDSESYHINQEENGTKHRIIQLCTDGLAEIRQSIGSLEVWRELRQKLSQEKLEFEKEPKTHQEPSNWEVQKLESLNRNLPYLEKVHDLLTAATLDTVEGRAVGYIADMPPFEASPKGHIRDWALIRLDEAKFADTPKNSVHVSRIDYEFLWSANHTFTREKPECGNDGSRFLDSLLYRTGEIRIQGFRSQTESHVQKSFWVGKRGATTGLTFGVVNEIKAVVSAPATQTGDIKSIGLEWVVVSAPYKNHGTREQNPRFAKPGDSGAAVFDFEGRVIGFIGSGFDQGRGYNLKKDEEQVREAFKKQYDRQTDLTFITPIDIVLEDIRQETKCDVEII